MEIISTITTNKISILFTLEFQNFETYCFIFEVYFLAKYLKEQSIVRKHFSQGCQCIQFFSSVILDFAMVLFK